MLKPEAFQRCFQAWISDTMTADASNTDRLVAIDGKTCRGSHDHAKDLGVLPIVSAWATEEGIALGQVATDAKSNEITAIPHLLEQIDLEQLKHRAHETHEDGRGRIDDRFYYLEEIPDDFRAGKTGHGSRRSAARSE